jgi:hypothetical protein
VATVETIAVATVATVETIAVAAAAAVELPLRLGRNLGQRGDQLRR